MTVERERRRRGMILQSFDPGDMVKNHITVILKRMVSYLEQDLIDE